MIQITKGNPTPEEVAALVAVVGVGRGAEQNGPTRTAAAGWRRTGPLVELNPAALSRSGRRWRPWSAGWSRVGPALAPVPHRVHWSGTRNVS
jgi:Acyl-CoA carboxylase epsilon subunit